MIVWPEVEDEIELISDEEIEVLVSDYPDSYDTDLED